MDLLPDEVIMYNIIPDLNSEQILNLCQTSSRFQKLCQNDKLWEFLAKSKFSLESHFKPENLTWNRFYLILLDSYDIPIYSTGGQISKIRLINNFGYLIKNVLPIVPVTNEFMIVILSGINPTGIYYSDGETLSFNYNTMELSNQVPSNLGDITSIFIIPQILKSQLQTKFQGRGRKPKDQPMDKIMKDFIRNLENLIINTFTSGQSIYGLYEEDKGLKLFLPRQDQQDQRIKQKGKLCNTYHMIDLINILWKYQILPDITKDYLTFISSDQIDISRFTDTPLIFLYNWLKQYNQEDICSALEIYLNRIGHLLYL